MNVCCRSFIVYFIHFWFAPHMFQFNYLFANWNNHSFIHPFSISIAHVNLCNQFKPGVTVILVQIIHQGSIESIVKVVWSFWFGLFLFAQSRSNILLVIGCSSWIAHELIDTWCLFLWTHSGIWCRSSVLWIDIKQLQHLVSSWSDRDRAHYCVQKSIVFLVCVWSIRATWW